MTTRTYTISRYALLIVLIESTAPPMAFSAEGASMLGSSLKMIWGLLVVLGILLIIYGLVKKRVSLLHGGGNGIIKVIESRHLMPKKSLFLIEVRGREYLVGSGADSLNLITPIGSDNQSSPSFKSILKDSESSQSI